MLDYIISKGLLPDIVVRVGIRKFLKQRIENDFIQNLDLRNNYNSNFIKQLKESPLAIETDKANDQHYQVPSDFFVCCLGKRLKYSCAFWDRVSQLDDAEEKMLQLYIQRGEIEDGMSILELGCGWGSLSLFLAEQFPNSQIVAISNSKAQKLYIENQIRLKKLNNLQIITENMVVFETKHVFDRVVSIEMFEHMRNYELLFHRISKWLKADGKMFVHIFNHKNRPYLFEVKDDSDWMSKYFFSGGIMPSEHLFFSFQKDLVIDKHWVVSGEHYAKTARAWLNNMDLNKDKIVKLFQEHYPVSETQKWWNFWRVFYMSCEELWGYDGGKEWFVTHYLFSKR